MQLSYPKGHRPRYKNFQLDGLLDETLREGAERCLFSVNNVRKLQLIGEILDSGVRDIILGSGPKDPQLLLECLKHKYDLETFPKDSKFAFILLLNSWEPIYEQFKKFPKQYLKDVIISFGMVEYGEDEQLLERVTEKFSQIGVETFRVSLINSFSEGIDEEKYLSITSQIDRSVSLGFQTIRVNDSLGVIYPEAMAILASNLTHQYPNLNFCLHAHNDKGLGLQNALISIYHGFNMIEGAFAGYGNRSGLPSIELLNLIFKEKNITIKNIDLKEERINHAAVLTEDVFMTIPNIYRPVSGILVKKENLGVANIPDYLGVDRKTDYFLNNVGLHINTIKRTLEAAGFSSNLINDDTFIQNIVNSMEGKMEIIYEHKRSEFSEISDRFSELYSKGVFSAADIIETAKNFLPEYTK
ncbi:isopropylmalate synthase [Alkalihalobacterium bogoriense]|uniref:isopropylmalate synthase n=1 Tax=Alkalihalobacterium bogoriense TaxID=246272 RepID=UPI000479B7E4|nr:isopropylmalate synthase [Alkalihalobacterium bogoriense]